MAKDVGRRARSVRCYRVQPVVTLTWRFGMYSECGIEFQTAARTYHYAIGQQGRPARAFVSTVVSYLQNLSLGGCRFTSIVDASDAQHDHQSQLSNVDVIWLLLPGQILARRGGRLIRLR